MILEAPSNTFTGKSLSRLAHLEYSTTLLFIARIPEAAFQQQVMLLCLHTCMLTSSALGAARVATGRRKGMDVSFALRGRSEHFRPLDVADAHGGALRVHPCPESQPRAVPAHGLRSLQEAGHNPAEVGTVGSVRDGGACWALLVKGGAITWRPTCRLSESL
jgi:hypothetical protein